MPRIDDNIVNCSVYLYQTVRDAENGEKTGGTGFVVGVRSETGSGGYIYAVTNSHVIGEGNSPIVRINAKPESAEAPNIYVSETRHWYHHLDGDDLAVLPLSIEISKYELRFVPSELFITDDIIKEENIGAGDEIFMVGRFIGYDGKQRNEPVVRFGNLSLGVPVSIGHEREYAQESYLVETRSLSGFSGSPVFVHVLPLSYRQGQKGNIGLHRGPWLLGVDWGHRDMHEPVLERNGDRVTEGWKVKVNSGMSYVVPAWKLYELLYSKELVDLRRQADAKREKK